MGLFLADGTRVTKTSITRAAEADPLQVIGTDLYLREPYNDNDPQHNVAGDKLTLFCRAGEVKRKSEIDNLFAAPTIAAITPATGGIGGNTVVTITGQNLDGVTDVKFGGTSGTVLTVLSPTKLTVKTPAHAAGAVSVDITDDGGSVSKASGFTFA